MTPQDGRNDGGKRQGDGTPAGRNKRTVWTVATQPYGEAHFATFPPKLIEPCVLAGTSPKTCGRCGAPWARIVELVGGQTTGRTAQQAETADGKGILHARYPSDGSVGDVQAEHVTAGWEPTCEHHDDSGMGVVLDPFAGAGTTGVVAGYLGRAFVGVELNATYAAMAERRIAAYGRPGDRHHQATRVADGQLDLELGT